MKNLIAKDYGARFRVFNIWKDRTGWTGKNKQGKWTTSHPVFYRTHMA